MARKQTRRRPPPAEEEEGYVDAIEQEIVEELTEFLEEFGANVNRCQVSRILSNGERQYLGHLGTQGLTHETIREAWGAGKYHLRFLSGNHFAKHLTVNIGPAAGQLPAAPGMAVQTMGESGLLREQLAMTQNMLLTLANAYKPPDIGGLLQGVAAIGGKNNSADPAAMLTAVVTAFTALKSATTPDGGLDIKKLKDVIALANELKPGTTHTEENLYTVVKDLGTKAIDTLQTWHQPAGALPPGQPGPAAGAPGNGEQKMNVADWVRAQLFYLKQKAMQNKQVEFWIDYILDNDEEPGCRAILQAIEGGATFEQLLQFDPEIAQNPQLQAWFKALYDGLHAEIQQAMDSARRAGNPANPGSDAGVSTGSGAGAPDPAVSGGPGEPSSH